MYVGVIGNNIQLQRAKSLDVVSLVEQLLEVTRWIVLDMGERIRLDNCLCSARHVRSPAKTSHMY